MIEGVIRPLVLCIVKNKDKVLVMRGHDSVKNQTFYRLLGGGIDFNELGEDALKREFQEELGTELQNITFITTTENIFEFDGKKGHEIILVFEADLANKELYEKESLSVLDSSDNYQVSWENISDFKDKKLIFYPEQVIDYL
jgi:ADP-ribose pyrophosphatase YjhB (NUDIX family)